MMKVNLIGGYYSKYRISMIEWFLIVLNLVLLVLALFCKFCNN